MSSGFGMGGSPSFELVESIDSHSSSRAGGAGNGLLLSVSACEGLVEKKSLDTIGVSTDCTKGGNTRGIIRNKEILFLHP